MDDNLSTRVATLRRKQWTPDELMKFRKVNRLTRKTLSQLVGVTVSSIYQWERRLKKPSMTARILLSRIEEELSQTTSRKGGRKNG